MTLFDGLLILIVYVALAVVASLLLHRRFHTRITFLQGGFMIGSLAMDNDATVRVRWTPESKGGNPVPLAELDPAKTTVAALDPTTLGANFDPADPTVIVLVGQKVDANNAVTVSAVNLADQTPVTGTLPVTLHDPDATQIVFDVVPAA